MDEAVWIPTPRWELGAGLSVGRHYAKTIFVNKNGQRFCNESNSYMEVTKAMYANDAVPAWLIFDDQFRRNRVWAPGLPKLRHFNSVLPGRMPTEFVSNGWIKKADSIEGLASQIDVDPATRHDGAALQRTCAQGARSAVPPWRVAVQPGTWGPGQQAEPGSRAARQGALLRNGDLCRRCGTSGGVVTNQYAQVLDQADQPFPGLYATGNMSATVMGRFYLGAGASIANTTVFGYVAALHAAGRFGSSS